MRFLKVPGLRKKRIYADAAASTPLSWRVRLELLRLLSKYGNPGGIHQEGAAAKRELERACATVAKAIGAHPDEIVFTASGTEANNLAIVGLVGPLLRGLGESDSPKPHVLTTTIEHSSVLEPLRALSREGLAVTELAVDHEGVLLPNALQEELSDTTVLVSIQLVNSEVGTIQNIREVAKTLRKLDRKVYLHTDASQAPLWMDLAVERLGVDLMTLDAQKILGPKGVGALYIKRGTPIRALVLGGGQEHGLRAGTENVLLAGAFAVALAAAQRKAERRAARVAAVRDYLWAEIIRRIPDTVLNGPKLAYVKGALSHPCERCPFTRVANNLNISIPGLEAQMGVLSLDALGVAASTRSACDTKGAEPSHVIQALGTPPELAGSAIRLTLLPSATKREALRVAEALAETAARYCR